MKLLFLPMVALLLAACASVPVPQTPAQAAYAAKGAYVAVATATVNLLEDDIITASQADATRDYLAEIRPRIERAIDIVRHGDVLPDTEVEWLRAVTRALNQILLELSHE